METTATEYGFGLSIIIGIVLVVIILQVRIGVELGQCFKALKQFMPKDRQAYADFHGNYHSLEMNVEVAEQIRSYIIANRHLAPNFDIIKDIVDRASGELDERVRTLLALPLYWGLCGTIAGIIFGVFSLSGNTTDLMNNLSPLLAEVGFAMIGSFVGIFITAAASFFYREVSKQHEQSKSIFFSWFQVTQLPVIGSNPSGPLGQLMRSLSSFNEDFSASAQCITETAAEIANTFELQRELLILMRKQTSPSTIDKNIQLAQELGRNVEVIRSFNNSIVGMQNYVEKLQTVTQELQSSTQYLKVTEGLVEILNSEQKAISNATGGLSQHIRDVHSRQQELIDNSLSKIKEQNEYVLQKFKMHVDNQARELQEHLYKHKNLPQALIEMGQLPTALKELQDKLNQMNIATQQQNEQSAQIFTSLVDRLEQLEEKLEHLAFAPGYSKASEMLTTTEASKPKLWKRFLRFWLIFRKKKNDGKERQ